MLTRPGTIEVRTPVSRPSARTSGVTGWAADPSLGIDMLDRAARVVAVKTRRPRPK